MTQQVYVAFSIHGTNCFITAQTHISEKPKGKSIKVFDEIFQIGKSRTQSENNALKLMSDKLETGAAPLSDPKTILTTFLGWEEKGWIVKKEDFIRKHSLKDFVKDYEESKKKTVEEAPAIIPLNQVPEEREIVTGVSVDGDTFVIATEKSYHYHYGKNTDIAIWSEDIKDIEYFAGNVILGMTMASQEDIKNSSKTKASDDKDSESNEASTETPSEPISSEQKESAATEPVADTQTDPEKIVENPPEKTGDTESPETPTS